MHIVVETFEFYFYQKPLVNLDAVILLPIAALHNHPSLLSMCHQRNVEKT